MTDYTWSGQVSPDTCHIRVCDMRRDASRRVVMRVEPPAPLAGSRTNHERARLLCSVHCERMCGCAGVEYLRVILQHDDVIDDSMRQLHEPWWTKAVIDILVKLMANQTLE